MIDKRKAEQLGEEKAKQYNPEGLSLFPFDVIVDDRKDIKVVYSDKMDKLGSGAIFYEKQAQIYFILINSSESKTRQNFTIAHELGHYFLHQNTII